MTRVFFFLLSFIIVCSCQQVETEQAEASQAVSPTFLFGTGEGTILRPFTANDIIENKFNNSGTSVWVLGYVIGATYRTMNNSIFSDTTQYCSNILISTDSTCTNIEKCIPVELSNQKLQKSYSLPYNPSGFRKCILLHGTPKTYFNRNGLRNIDEGHWMYGFDISTIKPDIQKWDTITYYSL